MKALLLIDLQYDFLPGGNLAVRDGDHVLPVAFEYLTHSEYSFRAATQDWHPKDHLSFASQHPGKKIGEMSELKGLPQVMWPDHCVQETHGAELAKGIREKVEFVSQKGMNREVDSYSGFFDNGRRVKTSLDDTLRARGIDSLTVMGLATDYCVKFTVLDALSLGYSVDVVRAGCRGVNLKTEDSALAFEAMAQAGARLI